MEKVLQEAVTKDHFIILVWAHVQGTGGWSPKLMDLAVELGRFQIVKWLHKYRFVGCTTAAMDAAAGDGRLDIVEWLHQHRYEGCTTEAMDRAVANGHMEVVKFLHEKRHEGCTVEAFEEAIKRRDVEIVKFLYRGRPELSEWPQPEHSTILKDLLLSWHPLDKEMLDYITSRRQERYLPFEHTEPTEYDEKQELENHRRPQSGMIYGLGRVLFVLNRKVPHFYWDYIGGIITQYLIRDPRTFFHPIEALNRGFAYWLAQYGPLGSGHLRWLTRRGQFDQARQMHEFMTKTGFECECDDHFKLLTMEHGDLAYIKWHIRNCRSMEFEEIVHQAVWTGRKDVIRWIQTRYITVKKSTSGGARWRLEPSLTYMDCAAAENDLATVKHGVIGEKGKCTTKAMDLAAANGHFSNVDVARGNHVYSAYLAPVGERERPSRVWCGGFQAFRQT
ncbi:hypothetical protein Poli38472_004448 [Pythium oligandrum]|uniref:Uncharacterized protein n=1 Tax=Pythium oligandrum TaxID=41045 RepID=A0A8K1C9U3_PYTOL|nr:hypothetical protein Poli38472_004448 [Pythium oligandrum]|eukprot:TMW59379.1 hypothetical protein Poli38472_004448 [Pythium oligandrum]